MAATNLSFDPSAPGPARPRWEVTPRPCEHGRATVSRRLRFVARVLAIHWGPRENHKPPRPPNPLRLKGGQPQDKSGCWAVPGHVWGVGWVAWVGKGWHFPQPSNEPGPKMQQNFTLNPAQSANTCFCYPFELCVGWGHWGLTGGMQGVHICLFPHLYD